MKVYEYVKDGSRFLNLVFLIANLIIKQIEFSTKNGFCRKINITFFSSNQFHPGTHCIIILNNII